MKYKIKYTYKTGKSFGSHTEENFLEIEFSNIKVAEDNLDRINDHYIQYNDTNSYSRKNKLDEIFNKNKNKDWFVKVEKLAAYLEGNEDNYNVIDEKEKNRYKEKGYLFKNIIDATIAENCIILYTDEGEPYQFWAPWCGYFETLYQVEIMIESKKYEY